MDFSPSSRRPRRVPTESDLYSTVIVHGDGEDDETEQQEDPRRRTTNRKDDEEDIYATMMYKKDDQTEDYDEDEDDSSLPPLLKRLPKDFGIIDGEDDDTGSISGTMIVKTDRSNRNRSSSPWNPHSAPLLDRNRATSRRRIEEDEEGDFSTFVVRSTVRDRDIGEREPVSGTVVRRTSGGGGGMGSSTMSRAVASMRAVGELGFGKKQKGSTASSWQDEDGWHGQQSSKVSSSSIPECVTREDPATKYELLNELGKLASLSSPFAFETKLHVTFGCSVA